MYHHCTAAGSLQTFLCPNGTAFSQQSLVCEWWHDVSCPPNTKTTQPVKESSLQSLTDDVGYPVYRWPTRTQQLLSPPAVRQPTTTQAPQPPSYSSSVSFSVAAGTKAHTLAPFTGSGGAASTEYTVGLGGGKLQNGTLTFQAGDRKIVRARKLVTKIRGSTASQGSGGQKRQRSKESSTTQSPDAKSSAE